MNDIQIKGSEDYGKLCCFRDDEGNEEYGHLSLFMKANSNNPNERDMYFRLEDGKAYRMAWKVDEEDVLSPDEEVIHDQNKMIERLQEQLDEAIKITKDQELIIKKLKRRRICDNQKTEARKEHINELIEQVKELKEEIARRGRIINELKIQRKEANEIIQTLHKRKEWDGFDHLIFGKYLEKWGVK